MVGMTSAEIITDAGHCSTLHIYEHGYLFALSCSNAGPCWEISQAKYHPAHCGHQHHNIFVLHLAETTITTYGPLYSHFELRKTASCNTNIYFAQKPAHINELYISNWHVLQQTSHISLNKKTQKKRPTNKTWNSHGQIYGAKNKSSFPGCEVWRLFFEVWGWCLSFEVGLPPTMCHVGGVGWACCLWCWVQSIFRAPILFCSQA